MQLNTSMFELYDDSSKIFQRNRSVGAAFFGNYYLMDFKLMGGDTRQAIIDEDAKRKINATLPPQVPFGSHQWPTLITPGAGAKTLADLS